MNECVKISVVVPVYNVQAYLRQCMESILAQSLQEIEIICVDDGSIDDSVKILKEYENTSDKVSVLHQENRGAGSARNWGIDNAHGKYIAFIDPDDYYASDSALETLYCFAEQNKVMICGGNMKNTAGEYVRKRFTENEKKIFTDLKNCGAHCCNIYNLDFLKKNNIYYPNYRRFQDPPFLAKAMITAKEFFAVDIDVYVYRTNHKRLNYNEDVLINVINGIKDILTIVRENNFPTEFPLQVLEENRTDILWHSMDSTQKAKDALKELNREILKVLGQQFVITQNEIKKYKEDCENIYVNIKNRMPIIIYGAGKIGKAATQMIDGMNGNIIGVAVADREGNPQSLETYPVNPIGYYDCDCGKTMIILAVGKMYQEEVLKNIGGYGFQNIYIWDTGKRDYIEEILMKEVKK